MTVNNDLVLAQGLVKRYRTFALGPIDLQFAPGYVYGIVGQNGAGKTTLLKLLMNLVRPTQGTVRLFGMDYAHSENLIKQRIGYVPEEPFLYQLMKPSWFGRFVSAYYPTWSFDTYNRLLHELNVDCDKTVKELSRGTRVKLELALALAHSPELLLLDEPTSGLDPLVRREILDQLADVVQDEHRTVVFSTHITEDVERIADYIVFMVNGNIALVEQREALRDQWQELVLDVADATNLPGVVRVKNPQEPTVQAIVSDAGTAVACLQQKGKSPLCRRPLALDEILQELVKASASAA